MALGAPSGPSTISGTIRPRRHHVLGVVEDRDRLPMQEPRCPRRPAGELGESVSVCASIWARVPAVVSTVALALLLTLPGRVPPAGLDVGY